MRAESLRNVLRTTWVQITEKVARNHAWYFTVIYAKHYDVTYYGSSIKKKKVLTLVNRCNQLIINGLVLPRVIYHILRLVGCTVKYGSLYLASRKKDCRNC